MKTQYKFCCKMTYLTQSFKISKFQFDFTVNVWFNGVDIYSIYIYLTDNANPDTETTKYSTIKELTETQKNAFLSKLDDTLNMYLESKEIKYKEISESQVIYEGLTTKPHPCGCCKSNICFYQKV